MDLYPPGFEERDDLRSSFIRNIILCSNLQTRRSVESLGPSSVESAIIPKRLIRYWHDPSNLPEDVRSCLQSWDCLVDEGFEFHMFDDASAGAYIEGAYGERESKAFARCSHPAMR